MNKIQLQSSCILKVPFQTYENDFSFIVNGEEFKTSRFVSDILSPVICQNHLSDPTIDKFTIETTEKGNFSLILELVKFNEITFPENEIKFVSEVIEILGNESIEYNDSAEISIDNVFNYIKNDEKKGVFYHKRFENEIEFISSHFYEICENKEEELEGLSIETLFEILNNEQLQLKNEDQLLNFINKLYQKNSQNSFLYETVYFENVSIEKIGEFISVFDNNDMTTNTWNRISIRLLQELKNEINEGNSKKRYTKDKKNSKMFLHSNEKEFNGIIRYLQSQSQLDDFSDVINISASSIIPSFTEITYNPSNTILYENMSKFFISTDSVNSWICFEFLKNKVMLTDYTIKSSILSSSSKPLFWVIEGSNDKESWEIIDKQDNCQYLNGIGKIHNFTVNDQNQKEFKFIRMRQTGLNSKNRDILTIGKIEFYGVLI